MPPGQPVHRCTGCELLRPCRRHAGRWYCLECNPAVGPSVDETAASAPGDAVATDGGSRP